MRAATARRERGGLEREVLHLLWRRQDGLTSRELEESFEPAVRPARTTLLTVLSRLEDKGLVERTPAAGGALFRAATPEEEHVAMSMSELLDGLSDRAAALSRFVGHLDEEDREALRRLVDRDDG